MDLTVLRAAVLIVLVIGFLGTWAWAWSSKRKSTFERAARMPLEEDRVRPARSDRDDAVNGNEPC